MNREVADGVSERPPILWVEVLMGALALVTVWLAFEPDTAPNRSLSWTVWGVFVAEYSFRFLRAPRRLAFVKANLPDLVAVIPVDILRGFRLFRLLRVLLLLRGFAVLRRVAHHIAGILRTNGLGYALVGTGVLVIGGGLVIHLLEPDIKTIADGLWWSLVTATTVGYGDISPRTTEGRLVAAVLMLVGVGMIGMVTGSIATYFIGHTGTRDPHVRHIQKQLDGWEGMTREERLQAAAMLRTIAEGVSDGGRVRPPGGTENAQTGAHRE